MGSTKVDQGAYGRHKKDTSNRRNLGVITVGVEWLDRRLCVEGKTRARLFREEMSGGPVEERFKKEVLL